jgi:alpha-tubulin suppressor-like RCC1 family protein
VVPNGLRDITAISAGREYSMAMTKEGVVYAWGRNDNGQAKIPRLPFAASSIGAGYVNSVIGLRDARVIAFGNSSLGALVSRTPTRIP